MDSRVESDVIEAADIKATAGFMVFVFLLIKPAV